MGKSSKTPNTRYFASELKCLTEECDEIIAFPPGHVYDSNTDKLTRYFEPTWWDSSKIPQTPVDYKQVRETLELAVRKRLMAEVPYGVLLSGGLDSSLIASIAARETKKLPLPSVQPVLMPTKNYLVLMIKVLCILLVLITNYIHLPLVYQVLQIY